MTHRHTGSGDMHIGGSAPRPTESRILETLSRGRWSPVEGSPNSVQYLWKGVKVIINREMPWQSTSLAVDMAEYPDGVSKGLSGDDRDRLEATQVPLGEGVSHTVADLIVGYAAHVSRLDAEHGLHPGDDRDLWNAHDLIATLIIRDLAERGLGLLDGQLRSRAARAVALVDERLRSFTELDERHLVRRFAAEDAGQGWWWDRIPRSGPIRSELLQFAERTVSPPEAPLPVGGTMQRTIHAGSSTVGVVGPVPPNVAAEMCSRRPVFSPRTRAAQCR